MVILRAILLVIVLAVCVEAITELVVKSKIFLPLRNLFEERTNKVAVFFGGLLSCGHCFSVWASAAACSAVVLFNPDFFCGENKIVSTALLILLVHRLANYLHFCVDRVDKFYRKR